MQAHDERWIAYFRAHGDHDVEPLATGMEGAVYRLGPGRVAKVWGGDKPHSQLSALARFYADLARESLPFATPEIIDLSSVDGTSVSIERELPGRPLQDHVSEGATHVERRVRECVGIVLDSLAALPDLSSAHALAVLSESRPFRGRVEWPIALGALLERRVELFGDQLRARVADFDDLYGLVTDSLRMMRERPTAVVHGDICGVNILVDDELRPTALLDWGFLSTAGDPAFDASVAAGIFDMYSDSAGAVDADLVDYFGRRLDIATDHLLAYRAAYAIATSNAYDPTGRDGHFAWCVRALHRTDIRRALERCASR